MGARRSQGQDANHNGNVAEQIVDAILTANGAEFERHKHVGNSIYGHPLYVDFYLPSHNCTGGPLCLECKWQSSPGSADEKFPYLRENILSQHPAPTIVVYGGDGAKSGAIQWLRGKADGEKLLAVLSVEEFIKWANKNL